MPFVQEAVFLHHPGLRCLLPSASRIDLFGLDGSESETGLPGISERLLEPATPHQSVGANRDEIIAALMARIGVVQRRQREAGSWVIDEEPLGEGDGWQDWPAFHRVATTDRARIRFLVTPPGTTSTTRAKVRQVAEHEYRIMSRLANDRLLRPRDMVDNDLGVGLVYPLDEQFQRLDLWLADQAGQVPAAGPARAAAPGGRGGGVRAPQPGRAPRPDPARRPGPPRAGRRDAGAGRRLAERGNGQRPVPRPACRAAG